jgi:hypothetical protein
MTNDKAQNPNGKGGGGFDIQAFGFHLTFGL